MSPAAQQQAEPWYEPIWRGLQIWGVPLGMGMAYTMLIWSADTDPSGKAWLSVGFLFVLVIWFVFRMLTNTAALERAIGHGDVATIDALVARNLAHEKSAAGRAPYLIARAFAAELRKDWPAVLEALAEAKPDALPPAKRSPWIERAASSRIAALLAEGNIAEARELLPVLPANARPHTEPYLLANIATGRVLLAEGKRAEAAACFAKVTNDIKATLAMRAAATPG